MQSCRVQQENEMPTQNIMEMNKITQKWNEMPTQNIMEMNKITVLKLVCFKDLE